MFLNGVNSSLNDSLLSGDRPLSMGKTRRIFISSTIYDLRDLRNALKVGLVQRKYEVLANEDGSIPVDSNLHSYDSCIAAAKECDCLVAVIDNRFGGVMPDGEKSITQAEIEAAIDAEKSVYVFVRKSTWDAKEIYKRYMAAGNGFEPTKLVHDPRVFELIDWVRNRHTGNWIFQFDTPEDILEILDYQIASSSLTFSLRKDRFLDIPDTVALLDERIKRKGNITHVIVEKGELLQKLHNESEQSFDLNLNQQLEHACLSLLRPWIAGELTLSSLHMAECLHWTCRIDRDELLHALAGRTPNTSPIYEEAKHVWEATRFNQNEWRYSSGMANAARFFEWPTVQAVRLSQSWNSIKGIVVDTETAHFYFSYKTLRDFPDHVLSKYILPQISEVSSAGTISNISDDELKKWEVFKDDRFPIGHAADAK